MVIGLIMLIIFMIIHLLIYMSHLTLYNMTVRHNADELSNSEGLGFPMVNFLLNKKTTNPRKSY